MGTQRRVWTGRLNKRLTTMMSPSIEDQMLLNLRYTHTLQQCSHHAVWRG